MSARTLELLIEIGTEEIPSNMLRGLLPHFERGLTAALTQNGLLPEGAEAAPRALCAPRRLVYIAPAVRPAEADRVEEITGPPTRIAFDADGQPTRAALGFARGQGVSPDDLYRLQTKKGEIIAVKKHVAGRSAVQVLGEAIPELLRTLPQPKTMRWGAESFAFIRPIHWMLVLLGGEVVPVEVAGVQSGACTRGHRFRGNAAVEVQGVESYLAVMDEAAVIVDQDARAAAVAQGLADALARLDQEKGGRHVVSEGHADSRFLKEVSDLTESPRVEIGSFEERFLEVPAEVLVTAMEYHQRYFPIWREAEGGRALSNRFAVVTNMPPDASPEVVRGVVAGNERVLRARLADARFFFDDDRKRPLEGFIDELKGRIFLQGLGTMHDKVERMDRLAERFADILGGLAPCFAGDALKAQARRAARLAKADLGTEVVGEFPELQGIMGAHYARADGEAPDVACAVDEHYRPRFQGDEIPSTREGTIVSLADKLDSIVGAYALGLEPTGSQDPYALRRQAIGVIRVLLQDQATNSAHEARPLDLDARALITAAAESFGGEIVPDVQAVTERVVAFMLGRFKVMLQDAGRDTNRINAVLGTGSANVSDLVRRLDALDALSGSEDFEPMMIAFKRVMNISKDHADVGYTRERFTDGAEATLADAFEEMAPRFDAALAERDYPRALQQIVTLKPTIDGFFDEVMVMSDDEAVRANRLGFMRAIADRFRALADFTRVQV